MDNNTNNKLTNIPPKESFHQDDDLPEDFGLGPYFMFNVFNEPYPPDPKSGPNKRRKLDPAKNRLEIWSSMHSSDANEKKAKSKDYSGVFKKVMSELKRETKKRVTTSQRQTRDNVIRARRLWKESVNFWKQHERNEKKNKKCSAKETEQHRINSELIQLRKQKRKLSLLLTQTELYSSVISGSLNEEKQNEILQKINIDKSEPTENMEETKKSVLEAALRLAHVQRQQVKKFEDGTAVEYSRGSDDLVTPPGMFVGTLKSYQLKGMRWLVNLHDQGINGILADEMGLGKTVQSICFLTYLAEVKGIWGPFLVIAPSSTLHNWQKEMSHFSPQFKVIPYWGNASDRKVLRQLWKSASIHKEGSSFHVVITSYKIVVKDFKSFQRIKWWYVILDEAHAIKNTSSQRWRTLMSLKCRNRLLLTGTPIQNSMQELWALLHFIMPNLFDSHDEFNEWFSRDIESCADQPSRINESQLSRLHSILKPFMLRRIKKDVEFELTEKIEVMVHCGLSKRQRLLYQAMKNQISPRELLTYGFGSSQQVQLMNIVMQFRKVCNHPDLFCKRDVFVTQYWRPESFYIPAIVANQGARPHRFNIYHPSHTHRSKSFSFAMDLSPTDLYNQSFPHFDLRCHYHREKLRRVDTLCLRLTWSGHIFPNELILTPTASRTFKFPNIHDIPNFSRHCEAAIVGRNGNKIYRVDELSPVAYPSFMFFHQERIVCHTREAFTPDRGICHRYLEQTATLRDIGKCSLTGGQGELLKDLFLRKLAANYWNCVRIPARSLLVIDSGKLVALDKLLCRLKREDHRVLIFSQMTRMIGILEDYMALRRFSYVRLDGSLQINKREDMVENFQSNQDVFVFLLSTRAGGIGINLTAADTVIFYDSDWNPTMDLQAMDRTHRLGQKKQVTVYRLICKDTIEDRIMQRAREKSEIQQMVISGGKYKAEPQSTAPNEVLKMLLDETGSASQELDTTFQYLLNAANSPVDSSNEVLTIRRRGRPAGSKNKKTLLNQVLAKVDPPNSAQPPPPASTKRRGRPVGSKNKAKLFKDGVNGFSSTAINNAKYGNV